MPSVLLTTSGLDEVLRSTHLEGNTREKKYIKSPSNKDRLWLATMQETNSSSYWHYELTFDSADQKTALVRQVVNHLVGGETIRNVTAQPRSFPKYS